MDSLLGLSSAEIVRMIGDRYRKYRMRANMTQKDVSEKSGVSTTTISNLRAEQKATYPWRHSYCY